MIETDIFAYPCLDFCSLHQPMKYLHRLQVAHALLLFALTALFYVTHVVVMDWVRVLVYNAYGN